MATRYLPPETPYHGVLRFSRKLEGENLRFVLICLLGLSAAILLFTLHLSGFFSSLLEEHVPTEDLGLASFFSSAPVFMVLGFGIVLEWRLVEISADTGDIRVKSYRTCFRWRCFPASDVARVTCARYTGRNGYTELCVSLYPHAHRSFSKVRFIKTAYTPVDNPLFTCLISVIRSHQPAVEFDMRRDVAVL